MREGGNLQESLFCESVESFHKKTGAHWIHEMKVVDPNLTFFPSEDDRDWHEFLLERYERYLNAPPELYMEPSRTGHTLHTKELIQKGSIVVEYLGEWNPPHRSPYRFGPIDALYYRNWGAMIDDSFPNLAPCYLYGVGGLPLRIVFLALEDIEAGSVLTFNYGMRHGVKLSLHEELRMEPLISFLETHSFKELTEEWKGLRKRNRSELKELNVDFENLTAKIQYLFQTPTTLARVLDQGLLDIRELKEFYQKPDHRFYFLGFLMDPHPREKEIKHMLEILFSV